MSKPCAQLNSKIIRDTAECHIIAAVQRQCSVVAFKCIWRVKSEEVERAWRWICEKRDECDTKLFEMNEIVFFFSAISTSKLQVGKKRITQEHPNSSENEDPNEETCVNASQLSTNNKQIFPAITYWAACQTPNGSAINPLKLQQALVKCGVEVYMSKTSTKKGSQHLNQLCQVLKDHKNPCLMDLVATSYQHCLSNLEREVSGTSTQNDACATENVVRLRVKDPKMKASLTTASRELRLAGLLMDSFGLDEEYVDSDIQDTQEQCSVPNKPLSCPVTVLCNDIQLAMKKLHYTVHEGEVFKRDPRSMYTYKHLCPMKTFILSLMGNESFKDRLVQHHARVLPILSDPESCVIPQLKIIRDVVEVNDGWFWSFSTETFVQGLFKDVEIGHQSPRAFVPYDSTKDPEPLYFKEILKNSLSDDHIQLFCEDFLALFRPKQHKQPVPCAIGASDSGKTSLFAPVFQIVPVHRIARVTKQKAFNKSMIDPSTEIIFLDEAYASLLDVDDWKILCQGGYTSHDTKWKKAKGFHCQATMYITCQSEKDFGEKHNAAMDRRLHKYFFESLPTVKPEAHQWLREHAMDCIVWASRQASQRSIPTTSTTLAPLAPGLSEQDLMDITSVRLSDETAETSTEIPAQREEEEEEAAEDNDGSDDDDDDDDNDLESDVDSDDELHIIQLQNELVSCDPLSLRGRQLKMLLDRAEEAQKISRRAVVMQRRKDIQKRRNTLIELGVVSKEEAAKLITDARAPLPDDLQKKYDEAWEKRKETQEKERKARELDKVKTVYQNPWLISMEKELARLTEDMAAADERGERRRVIKSLLEINLNKLRMFHEKEGTLGLQSAVKERRKVCRELGLLKKSASPLVVDVHSQLPLATDTSDGSEEDNFVTPPPTPSYVPRDLSMATSPPQVTRFLSSTQERYLPHASPRQAKRKRGSQLSGQNKVTMYFSQL